MADPEDHQWPTGPPPDVSRWLVVRRLVATAMLIVGMTIMFEPDDWRAVAMFAIVLVFHMLSTPWNVQDCDRDLWFARRGVQRRYNRALKRLREAERFDG